MAEHIFADTTSAPNPGTDAAPAAGPDPLALLSPVDVLKQLDHWMAADGMDTGHPWRGFINRTVPHVAAATAMSTTVPDPAADEASSPHGPLFVPFEWASVEARREPTPGVRLAADAYDIALGVKALVQIMERDSLAAETRGDSDVGEKLQAEDRPIFDDFHRAVLTRLAIASLGCLGDQSRRYLEWADRRASGEL